MQDVKSNEQSTQSNRRWIWLSFLCGFGTVFAYGYWVGLDEAGKFGDMAFQNELYCGLFGGIPAGAIALAGTALVRRLVRRANQ